MVYCVERDMLSRQDKAAVRIVMLAGASIYLAVFGLAMLFGPFTWTPDFLGTHGEPFLVIAFALFAAYEASTYFKQLAP